MAVAILIIGRFRCDDDRLDPGTKELRGETNTGFPTAWHNRGPGARLVRAGVESGNVRAVSVGHAAGVVPPLDLESAYREAEHADTAQPALRLSATES